MEGNTAKEWAEELDALLAAPQHHKLLFENELVRVLDANIPPGEMTNVHTHKYPASLYFISWSDFMRYDAEGNLLLDSRTIEKIPLPGTAMWSGPLAPHALKNVGDTNLHVISVEIKPLMPA
jgi:isopentenyldiphosphate isomerase